MAALVVLLAFSNVQFTRTNRYDTHVGYSDRLILWRLIRSTTGRQHRNIRVHVETKEEWHRVSVHSGNVLDAVDCGQETVVGQTHEEVANVDYEGSLCGRSRHPFSVCVQDIQTTSVVLMKDCEACQSVSGGSVRSLELLIQTKSV